MERAFVTAEEAHRGQFRKTGEPYIFHPIAVTELLAEAGADVPTLIAGLLHDVVEDTDWTREDIERQFGSEVAHIVDGVTKIDRLRYKTTQESQAATIRKMVLAMAEDTRVVVVKLADRLHNLRTIDPMPDRVKQRVTHETLQVYAPLAARFGIETWKHELEERAFKVAMPDEWVMVDRAVKERHARRDQELAEISATLEQAFREQGLTGTLEGREKHYYSIWRKMREQGRPFADIYDLIGLRFICETVGECYAALGIAHATFPPVTGRFFDHIAMPKPSGYQSLHTTLIGPGGKPFELQIRTREMHHTATYGVAAHWMYKELGDAEEAWRQAKEKLSPIREPAEEAEEVEEYFADLVGELTAREEVYVLTPKGEPVALPAGATPVDFAYRIHTEVGHACRGAKVNGRLVRLDTKLQTGDIVEIITSRKPNPVPIPEWLSFVVTTKARAKIRRRLEDPHGAQWEKEGREAIWGLDVVQEFDDEIVARKVARLAAELGYDEAISMYRAVGSGKIGLEGIALRLGRLLGRDDREQERTEWNPPSPDDVIVGGWEGVAVRFAACCEPEPPDEIVGYVTVGRGVSIHQVRCANVNDLEAPRLVEVAWRNQDSPSKYGWLRIVAADRSGLMAELAGAISELGAFITDSESHSRKDGQATLRFRMEVSGPHHLDEIRDRISEVHGVVSAIIEVR